MATEQAWGDYNPQAFLALADTILVGISGDTAGARVAGSNFVAKRTSGGNFVAEGTIEAGLASGVALQMADNSAIRNVINGASIMYFDVSAGGATHGSFVWRSSNTFASRMVLDGAGNLGIGASSTGAKWHVSASGQNGGYIDALGVASGLIVNKNNTAGGLVIFNYGGTGVGSITTTGSATAYNTSSDGRLKEDLQPVDNALGRLCSIPVWNFAWKATGARTDGFVAHELAEIVPCAVTGDKDAMQEVEVEIEPARASDVLGPDGTPVIIPAVTEKRLVPAYQGIDQSKLVPLLIAAVQELAARVAELEAAQ